MKDRTAESRVSRSPLQVTLVGAFPPPNGGVQTHIAQLREFLLAHGHRCDGISLGTGRKGKGDGVHVPANELDLLRLLWTRRRNILHLHVGGRMHPRLLGLVALSARLAPRRCAVTVHSGGLPTSPFGRQARPATLGARAFSRVARIICVNDEIAQVFAKLGIPPDRVCVISPYAFRPRADITLPRAIQVWLRRHRPLWITVGLLEPEYGLPLMCRAFRRFRERVPTAGLLVVGSGSLRHSLQAQFAEESILFTGDLGHAHTLSLMERCDAYIRTTRYDGDSLSLREALQMGLPALTTDNGMRPPGTTLLSATTEDRIAEQMTSLSNTVTHHGERKRPSIAGSDDNLAQVEALLYALTRNGAPQASLSGQGGGTKE